MNLSRTIKVLGPSLLAILASCAPQAARNNPATHPADSPATAPALGLAPFDARRAGELQETWARHLRQPREVTNAIGQKLVLLPPGEFMMGSPDTEAQRTPKGETLHRARITKPFYMAAYEVTQDEFNRIMGYNPSYRAARVARMKQNYDVDTSRFPVERVSWNEAVEFCRRLSELPAEKAAGRVYRLPTEAQWEYACRAGTTTAFPFGPALNGRQANVHGGVPYGTTEAGPSLNRPATVGSYPANAFGLYDMIGNMWEWCADRYGADYYATAPVDDPAGPTEGPAHVIRGGAWRYPPAFCRAAMRYAYDPRIRAYDLGFRVATDVPSGPLAPAAKQTATSPAGKTQPVSTARAAGEAALTTGSLPAKGTAWTSPAVGMEFAWIQPLEMWVAKYETTNGEYRKKDPAHNNGKFLTHDLNGDRQPVAMVSLRDATAYAEWLTQRDREQGRLPEGYHYRLPFEKEWLAFARCGQDVEFPWGNGWPPTVGNYRGQEAEGRGEKIDTLRDPYPVACDVENSGRNSWGLYGVGGNVWEACRGDCGDPECGAWRGGSWDSGTPGLLRCTFRSVGIPEYRFINYGFRLVLSPIAPARPKQNGLPEGSP